VHGARVTDSSGAWLERFEGLTHPPEALERARELFFPLASVDPEIAARFYEPGTCDCIGAHQDRTFRDFYWEDRYFMALALDLLESDAPFDLLAVYLRGIDSTGHMFLHLPGNAEFLKTCRGERCDTGRIEAIVESYYRYADEQIGALLQRAAPGTVTAVVTDHGQVAARAHGDHADNGFLILHGGPIRPRALAPSRLVDLVPTLLHLQGLPVAHDMDGSVLVDAIDPDFLADHPVRYVQSYEQPFDLSEKPEVIDAEAASEETERLRALGYVD
jgi:hypothetical protein